MSTSIKDVGFTFDSADLEKTKYFNLDGSMAIHVDVWVEAYDDKRFWLAHLPRGSKFKFYLKTPDEKKSPGIKLSTGCDRLFMLEKSGVIKLGKAQIFCLDSDDSFLKCMLREHHSDKLERDHLYVTKVYAIENVFLEPDVVDRVFETVSGVSVATLQIKPSDAIGIVSAVFSELVLMLAFYDVIIYKLGSKNVFKSDFRKVVGMIRRLDCRADFKVGNLFKDIQGEVNRQMVGLEKSIALSGNGPRFQAFKAEAKAKGYSDKRAYLFVKGHFIYDGLVEAFTIVAEDIRDAEIERVKKLYKKPDELERCIVNQWPRFDHALTSSYLAALPDVPFFSETRVRLTANYS